LVATVAVLIVSFTHIAKAVIAFEQGDNRWVSWAAAAGSELFLSLTGFGLGEIIKYKASQSVAKQKHTAPIFPGWMLAVTVVGLLFFALWVLWGNFYYTSVVAVNEHLRQQALLNHKPEPKWINVITWKQLISVDTFHLINSYIAALSLPVAAFMGTLLQTIFDLAASRIETNGAKGIGASRKGKNKNTESEGDEGEVVKKTRKPRTRKIDKNIVKKAEMTSGVKEVRPKIAKTRKPRKKKEYVKGEAPAGMESII